MAAWLSRAVANRLTETTWLSRLPLRFLFGLVILISGNVVSADWRWDDPSILLHLHQYSIVQDFINPEVWREFSPANLTPWLIFSYELDLILFGLNPGAFYLHQLLVLAAVASVFYITLRLWVRGAFALAGSALFLMGAPGITVAQQLMTRHYLEGLLFCLLSLLFFVQHLRRGSRPLLILSLLFYLLSVIAKETYVPLVLLLAFLPEGNFTRRLKSAIPFFITVLCYSLWRLYMLGTPTGGYVDSSEYLSLSFAGQVLTSFSRLPMLMFDAFWPLVLLLYIALAATYALICRSMLLLSLLVALLVFLPLVPLVSSPGINLADRYLLLPWLVMCFSMAFFSDRLVQSLSRRHKMPTAIGITTMLAITMVITVSAGLGVQGMVMNVGREYDVQARFIMANDNTLGFVPSATVISAMWFVNDLIELKVDYWKELRRLSRLSIKFLCRRILILCWPIVAIVSVCKAPACNRFLVVMTPL